MSEIHTIGNCIMVIILRADAQKHAGCCFWLSLTGLIYSVRCHRFDLKCCATDGTKHWYRYLQIMRGMRLIWLSLKQMKYNPLYIDDACKETRWVWNRRHRKVKANSCKIWNSETPTAVKSATLETLSNCLHLHLTLIPLCCSSWLSWSIVLLSLFILSETL